MSFKRDGDDKCALNNQRKRRVAELLGDDIQEEEVTQLSNGRYVCKLCSHRPIFDTINMFYVHKQGKKHQQSIEYSITQQQELEDLRVKRLHENMSQADKPDPNAEYQGCETKEEMMHRKPAKKNPYGRKPVLDLGATSSSYDHLPVTMVTTQAFQLPGNRSLSQTGPQSSGGRTIQNSTSGSGAQRNLSHKNSEKYDVSKNTQKRQREDFEKHHLKMTAGRSSNDNVVIKPNNIGKLLAQSDSQQRNMYYQSRKKQRFEVARDDFPQESVMTTLKAPEQTWEYYKDCKGPVTHFQHSKTRTDDTKKHSSQKIDPLHQPSPKRGVDCTKKERAEKFLNAFSSGWKKDRDGSWIKDEDVEFDSDEEPPDVC